MTCKDLEDFNNENRKTFKEEGVCRITHHVEGMTVMGNVDGVPVCFRIVTGARRTLISKKKFDEVTQRSHNKVLKLEGKNLNTAKGMPLSRQGTINAHVHMGPVEVKHKFSVAEINDEGIIGADFLRSHRCAIDVGKSEFKVQGQKTKGVAESLNTSMLSEEFGAEVVAPEVAKCGAEVVVPEKVKCLAEVLANDEVKCRAEVLVREEVKCRAEVVAHEEVKPQAEVVACEEVKKSEENGGSKDLIEFPGTNLVNEQFKEIECQGTFGNKRCDSPGSGEIQTECKVALTEEQLSESGDKKSKPKRKRNFTSPRECGGKESKSKSKRKTKSSRKNACTTGRQSTLKKGYADRRNCRDVGKKTLNAAAFIRQYRHFLIGRKFLARTNHSPSQRLV